MHCSLLTPQDEQTKKSTGRLSLPRNAAALSTPLGHTLVPDPVHSTEACLMKNAQHSMSKMTCGDYLGFHFFKEESGVSMAVVERRTTLHLSGSSYLSNAHGFRNLQIWVACCVLIHPHAEH